MIILDDQDQHSKKVDSSVAGSTTRVPEEAYRNSTTFSLPDYETSQAFSVEKPILAKTFFASLRADKRFWRAVLCAFVIYVAISFAIGIPFLVIALRRSADAWQPPPPWEPTDDFVHQNVDLVDLASSSNTRCNEWDTVDTQDHDGFLSAELQSAIPVGGAISFLSNYSHNDSSRTSFGSLDVRVNPNSSETQGIISLSLQYSDPALRKKISICITADQGARMTIFIPDGVAPSDKLLFNIDFLLPQSPFGLNITLLETYLPLFTQQFEELDGVFFDTLHIEGPASSVTAGYLQGGTISVKTSMAMILGVFNASRSLTLDTMSAPINASITLVHEPTRTSPTRLNIHTGNSDIHAGITLIADASPGDPKFMMTAKTFNGPMNVVLSHAASSPPTIYSLRALNNLGTTNVTVDSKYEGTFDVQTKFASVLVGEGPNADNLVNPYGDNQQRRIEYDLQIDSRLAGWVGWRQRRNPGRWVRHHGSPHEGRIVVESSLSPVNLQLSQPGEGALN